MDLFTIYNYIIIYIHIFKTKKDHLLNVSFAYGTETVQFDSNGNPPGWYDIMNYQRQPNQQYGYVQIGSWRNGTLDMPDWPAKMVTSVCSEPCQRGQIKVLYHLQYIYIYVYSLGLHYIIYSSFAILYIVIILKDLLK